MSNLLKVQIRESSKIDIYKVNHVGNTFISPRSKKKSRKKSRKKKSLHTVLFSRGASPTPGPGPLGGHGGVGRDARGVELGGSPGPAPVGACAFTL